jgi:hypothetical protein
MNILLERFSYSDTETEGRLFIPPLAPIFTMEQPWKWTEGFNAGIPYKSCCPEGSYKLVPYERSNGQKVWCMVNESRGVYFSKADTTEDWHRFKCLWHPGNLVSHTAGCVLPGIKRGFLMKGNVIHRAVMQSGFRPNYAMDLISKVLEPMSEGHTVTITQVEGAKFHAG